MKNDPLWVQREEYSKLVHEDKEYEEFLKAMNYLIDVFPNRSFKLASV